MRAGARAPSGVRRPPRLERDQATSAFGGILEAFVSRVPGARAAALVDLDGETVDYAGDADPFALRVAAAHLRIVLEEAHGQRGLAGLRSIVLRAARRTYLVHAMAEGYGMVVIFSRRAGFSGWERALAVCAHGLAAEAGWTAKRPSWFPVEVTTDARRRPTRVRSGTLDFALEVLGLLAGASSRSGDRAWRVRLESGMEAMLVRERGGSWYSDEPLLAEQTR